MGSSPSKNGIYESIPDLSGKVAVVTGGNSGIGFQSIRYLAKNGARVYLAARNEERAQEAIRKLGTQGIPDGRVTFIKLDLDSIKGSKEAGEAFAKQERRLDILLNNAGPPAPKYGLTKEGVLNVFASNYLGHYAFTMALMPLLKDTAARPNSDVRVVMVGSEEYQLCSEKVNFTTLKGCITTTDDSEHGIMTRHGMSKLAVHLFAMELQLRLKKENVPISVLYVHPGNVYSEGTHEKIGEISGPRPIIMLAQAALRLNSVNPEVGAATSLFACTALVVKEQPEVYKGAYLIPKGGNGEVAKVDRPYNNRRYRSDLWDLSARVVDAITRGESLEEL